MRPLSLLILGGTSQAREVAMQVASWDGLSPVLSLAGRTQKPLEQGVEVRTGGFGGVQGLQDYLESEAVDIVLDATHPYAIRMSRNAIEACAARGTPLLHIDRPAWVPAGEENWIVCATLEEAVAALPSGARAFSATGRGSLDVFAARKDIYTCLRVIDPSEDPFPGNGEFVVARPPFTVEAEIDVLSSHRATHLVVKNAGGAPARTKLAAAAVLGLPIVIVDRVPLPVGSKTVSDVRGALEWIRLHLR